MKPIHLTPKELAHRWNRSVDTLERWRSDGMGPVFLKLNGKVLYRTEDVESYENQCLRTSTSARVEEGGAA